MKDATARREQDRRIIAGLLAGDKTTFVEFFLEYSTLAYRIFLAHGMAEGDAEKVAADLVDSVARERISKFKQSETSSLRAWMSRVIENARIDWYRAHPEKFAALPAVLAAPQEAGEPTSRIAHLIRSAWFMLSLSDRRVLTLRHLNGGREYPQLSDILRAPEATVRQRYKRAKDRFEAALNSLGVQPLKGESE